jgi:hypothetical protein
VLPGSLTLPPVGVTVITALPPNSGFIFPPFVWACATAGIAIQPSAKPRMQAANIE